MGFMEEAATLAVKSASHRRRTGRPYVTLTYAQSLDGAIAARPGHPLALSCRESQTMTHVLRAELTMPSWWGSGRCWQTIRV